MNYILILWWLLDEICTVTTNSLQWVLYKAGSNTVENFPPIYTAVEICDISWACVKSIAHGFWTNLALKKKQKAMESNLMK